METGKVHLCLMVCTSVALHLQCLMVGKDEWQCRCITGQVFKLTVIQV